MVRFSIGYIWQINGEVLPGLTNEDHPSPILYFNGRRDRLCSMCATEVYETWLEQGEQPASSLSPEIQEELGDDAVYGPEVPTGYQVLRGGPPVFCDRCDEEI